MSISTQTAKLVDLVARVHGPNHPHLAEVKSLFHEVNNQLQAPQQDEVRSKLARIRELSNDFQTPSDGCEGYRMMDASLADYEAEVLANLDS